jgi:hypothetical protein
MTAGTEEIKKDLTHLLNRALPLLGMKQHFLFPV